MYLSKNELAKTERIKRLNIINSVSGIKPANLIGTTSKEHGPNLAIFSSVVHLSSNPGLVGFFLRSTEEAVSHTYKNILENGCFTVNHIHSSFIEKAHYTSAKFEAPISEFEACGLTEDYQADFIAPFVKESKFKLGLKHVETLEIKSSGTSMLVGEIQHLFFPDECINENGMVDLEIIDSIGVVGLNSYYSIKKMLSFPYARVSEMPALKK